MPSRLLRIATPVTCLLAWTACLSGCSNSVYVSSGGPIDEFTHRADSQISMPLGISAARKINLRLGRGSIEVLVDATGEPRIEGTLMIHGRSDEEARTVLDSYTLVFDDQPEGLTVRIEGDAIVSHKRGRHATIYPDAHYKVFVPANSRIDAELTTGQFIARGPIGDCVVASRYGAIELYDLSGHVRAVTQSGNVELYRLVGADINIQTRYGTIIAHSIEAGDLHLSTQSGSIEIKDCTAAVAEVDTRYGAIHVDNVEGEMTFRTSSGSIDLTNARGGPWIARSGYGGINARGVEGTTTLVSRSGNVTAADVSGAMTAETSYGRVILAGQFPCLSAASGSGSIEIEAESGSKAAADWAVRSNYGAITMKLPRDFACQLQAQTGYGSIDSEMPVTLERLSGRTRKELHGTINGGGNLMTIETNSGSIKIAALDEPKS